MNYILLKAFHDWRIYILRRYFWTAAKMINAVKLFNYIQYHEHHFEIETDTSILNFDRVISPCQVISMSTSYISMLYFNMVKLIKLFIICSMKVITLFHILPELWPLFDFLSSRWPNLYGHWITLVFFYLHVLLFIHTILWVCFFVWLTLSADGNSYSSA